MALVHDKNLIKLKQAAALSRQNALAEDTSGNTDAAMVSVLAADLIESVISDLEASNSPSQNAA